MATNYWQERERADPLNRPCDHAAIWIRARRGGGWDCNVCGRFFTVCPELSAAQKESLRVKMGLSYFQEEGV